MCHVSEVCIIDRAGQAHGKSVSDELALLLGGHHGRTSKVLVGHMAEMHGKWPMAACYF